MPYISWKDSMLVGVPLIDEQHRNLVELANTLHQYLLDGRGNSALKPVLASLVEYIILHFSEEERLMKQYDYPTFLAHKSEHDRYVQKIKEFIRKNKSDTPLLAREMLLFLGDWVRNHISREDQAYSPFLREHINIQLPPDAKI